MSNFWHQLPSPIVGLSPMDGVTDAPFRFVTAKHGRPDVIFTEFVPVEAVTHNAVRVMSGFLYAEIERPVVAQVYGGNPESFYKVAHVVCELGFDGLDINMGCPAKNVVHRGCGAGLIRTPDLAKEIVRACKRGVQDWVNGQPIEALGLSNRIVEWVRRHCEDPGLDPGDAAIQGAHSGSPRPFRARDDRKSIPISIKTRIGYSENIITDWVKHLLEVDPVAVSIHGRTLKQMYKGDADWEAIAAAAEIIHQTPTLVLGNGDVKSVADAVQKIRASGVDGVLIGRAAYGNPWVFTQKEEIREAVIASPEGARRSSELNWVASSSCWTPRNDKNNVIEVMLEHARCFDEMRPDVRYAAMRKHIAWYARWIPELRRRRKELMQVNSYEDLCVIARPDLIRPKQSSELGEIATPSHSEGSR